MDSDRIEGNLKEAEGKLKGDEALEQEGKAQDSWGKAKDSADDAYEREGSRRRRMGVRQGHRGRRQGSGRQEGLASRVLGLRQLPEPEVGDGSRKRNPSSAPEVAIHSVSRSPIQLPSAPPTSAPTGRTP